MTTLIKVDSNDGDLCECFCVIEGKERKTEKEKMCLTAEICLNAYF